MRDAYQIDFGPLMRVGVVQQVPAARFDKIASHFDVVMGEIEEKQLETVKRFGSRIQSEFRQFADKPGNFHFGLNVYLILSN